MKKQSTVAKQGVVGKKGAVAKNIAVAKKGAVPPRSAAIKKRAVQQFAIKTMNTDGSNVVNVILRVSDDGNIVEMFGLGETGRRWEVKKIRFTLNKKPGQNEDDHNDECKCCTVQGGRIACVTCACGG